MNALRNMFPSFPRFDLAYNTSGNPIIGGYNSMPSSVQAYLYNVSLGKFMTELRLALGRSPSSLAIHVFNIIRLSSIKKMIWIAALAIIASVKNAIFWFYSMMNLIGDSVRFEHFSIDVKRPIPKLISVSNPSPAFIFSSPIYFSPKSFNGGGGMHGTDYMLKLFR